MITTYEAKRRLKVGPNLWIEPTEPGGAPSLVPQVAIWPRHEAFLHTGHVKEIEVTEEAFEQALKAARPKLSDLEVQRIREHHGLGNSYGLHGPHKTPFTRTQVLKEAAEARLQQAIADDHQPLPGPVPSAQVPKPRPAKAVAVTSDKVPLKRAPRTRPVKKAAQKAPAKAAAKGA